MWTLLQHGDAAVVPSPSYPIHIYGPLFAGADIREVRLGTGGPRLLRQGCTEAFEYSWPKPRVIVMSFPHNPTTTCVDLDFMQRVVDFAREREVIVVHDNAYADLGYDGYITAVDPPGRGRQGGRRRAVLDDEVLLDGRLAGRVHGPATARSIAALDQDQELPRLRHLPARADRGHRHDERGARLPEGDQRRDLPVPARRASAVVSSASAGTSSRREGHDVRVGADPGRPIVDMGSSRVRQDTS